MAKFLPNYQPVTWKNVNTGNPNAFFNGAIQGGDTVFDQQTTLNETEDARLTNEAIAGSLRGEPTPFNRRVDQEALQQSKGYDDTLKSNLLTAGLERDKLGLEIEQMPEELRIKQEELRAKIANARSAEERNRLQAELNNIALSDEERIREEQRLIALHDQDAEDTFQGFLEKNYAEYDARNVPGANTQAGQKARFDEVQAKSQEQYAQYAANRQGSEKTGLPAYLRSRTQAGINETAAGAIERSEAEIIQKHTEKQKLAYENAYAASENELNAFIVMPDGTIGFGKPSEHKLSAGEAEIMLGDAASKNKSLKFRLEDLESEDKKNLSNAASTLSPSIAKEITNNVIKQSKVDGGDMDSQAFVKAWNKEAQRYRDKVFPAARERHASGDKRRYNNAELFDLYTGNVTKSGDPRLTDTPPPLSQETPEVQNQRVASLKNSFADAESNFEFLKEANGVGFNERREIQKLYDKLSQGKYYPEDERDPFGGPIQTKPVEISFEEREKALADFNKIVAKYRNEAAEDISNAELAERIKAGLK